MSIVVVVFYLSDIGNGNGDNSNNANDNRIGNEQDNAKKMMCSVGATWLDWRNLKHFVEFGNGNGSDNGNGNGNGLINATQKKSGRLTQCM